MRKRPIDTEYVMDLAGTALVVAFVIGCILLGSMLMIVCAFVLWHLIFGY